MAKIISFATVLAITLVLFLGLVQTADISFCSPEVTNKGAKQPPSDYQSNGLCSDACRDSYAYAIIKGKDCYCSNFAPENELSTQNCNSPCPGFPSEFCGSPGSGLYGYYELDLAPSGTSSRDTEVSTTKSRSASSSPESSSVQTTVNISDLVSEDNFSPTKSTTNTTPSLTLIPSSITPSPQSPTTPPTFVTITGNGTTITAIAPGAPTSDPALGQSSLPSGNTNVGKVAGASVGAALGLALLIALGVYIYRRRRNRNPVVPGTPVSEKSSYHGNYVSRHASQMSHSGLINKSMRINTNGLTNASTATSAGTSASQNHRHSAGTDMRLNPSALYAQAESHHSHVSLQDNRDYSRQLQVRNPDT